MNEQNNNKMTHQRYSTLFLYVLSAFLILFIGYLFYAHNTSVKSQKLIIESYAKHITKADSLYFSIAKYNNDILIANQNINNAILADSLIKETLNKSQKLSIWQRKNLEFTINNYFNEIEALHKQYEGKLSKDSLRLCTERELLEGQTKAILELHLGKIEHEYSNITMWGAILTILFLVFSFYSIFKMDELIKQGKEDVKGIKDSKEESDKIVKLLEQEKQEAISNMRLHLPQLLSSMSETQRQMNEQYKSALESTRLSLAAKSKEILEDFEEELTGITKTYKNTSATRQQEFDKIVTQANSILAQLKNNLNPK